MLHRRIIQAFTAPLKIIWYLLAFFYFLGIALIRVKNCIGVYIPTSGYTYKFFVYQGPNAQPRPKDVLLGTEVVLNLLEKISSDVSVFFDNFFTNMDLMKSLTELSIKASGTVRLNRLPGNPFGAKKDLIKKEKGLLKTAVDAIFGLFACIWKDNSIVRVLSNVDGVNPMKQANCRGHPVKVPRCITEYNADMLGVDFADWKTQKYRVA